MTAADLPKALDIIENAKASRPSVCNAEEVCLVHSGHCGRVPAQTCASGWAADRAARGCHPVELRLDERAAALMPGTVRPPGRRILTPSSWITFWPSKSWTAWRRPLRHIAAHSTGHSEAILTQDTMPMPAQFTAAVDSAAVYVNCLHPLHRWRRVWPWLRDGHFHPEAPRPGPHGAGRAVQLQVHHPRQRPDPLILHKFCIQAEVKNFSRSR